MTLPAEQTALHDLLWGSASVYAARLDLDGFVLEPNEAFTAWAGRPLAGTLFTDLVSRAQRRSVARALAEASDDSWTALKVGFENGDQVREPERLLRVRRDGAEVLVAAEPVQAEAERLVGEVLALNDDLIAAQRQVARRQRELERAQAETAAAAERARRLEAIILAGATSPDLDGVLQTLLEIAREVFHADRAAVLLRSDEHEGQLVVAAAQGLDEGTRAAIRVPIGRGIAGSIASTRRARIVGDLEQSDAVSAYLRESGGSLAGVPLVLEGEVIGVLHVSALERNRFTEEDLRLLERVGNRAALAIGHAQLRERERAVAETLQGAFLPESVPDVEGVAITARYRSRERGVHVGGDFYDAVELDDGRLVLAIGDVAGKGLDAASIMGRLRNGLRALALEGLGPADVLSRLDRMLADEDGMATSICLVLDPATGHLVFANAGHPPPLHVRGEGQHGWVEGGLAPPLGTAWSERPEASTTLAPGDRLVLYTDGLVERRTVPVHHGMARLLELASQDGAGGDIEALCDALLAAFAREGGGYDDDVALLAVEFVSRS